MSNLSVAEEGHHDVTTLDLQTGPEIDAQVSTSTTALQHLSFPQYGEQEFCMTEHEIPLTIYENFFDNCDIYIQFDTAFLSNIEALFKPFARSLRLVRHWRHEGLLLLAWLVHVGIIWTLQALEASDQTPTKVNS